MRSERSYQPLTPRFHPLIHKLQFLYKKIYNRYFSRSYFAFVGYKIEEYNIQKEEVKALKYITIEEMIKAKEERKKEYVFTKWNTFDRHIKLLKKQREKILELER